jgi:hypothetical protein
MPTFFIASSKVSLSITDMFYRILSINEKSICKSLFILISPFTIYTRSASNSFNNYFACVTKRTFTKIYFLIWFCTESAPLSKFLWAIIKNFILSKESSISKIAQFPTIIYWIWIKFLSNGILNSFAFIVLPVQKIKFKFYLF